MSRRFAAVLGALSLTLLVACSGSDPNPSITPPDTEGDASTPPPPPDAAPTVDAAAPVEINCTDGAKNGSETDVDCGGSCATKCADTKACLVDGDCEHAFCHPTTKLCVLPSCADKLKNGSETDVDCGGACTNKCANAQACAAHADCESGFCHPTTNKCAAPACDDTFKNGDETDADCGGACATKCAQGKGCGADADCATAFCHPTSKLCDAPACGDGFKNGSEPDKDCGGTCATKCADTFACSVDGDCASTFCDPGPKTCVLPSCADGFKNGSETDKDCGGSCTAKCADTLACLVDADCTSTFCNPATTKCAAPACGDGYKNGSETDKDCGGACTQKCADGESCGVSADCASTFCNPATTKCAVPACGDGYKNGSETDVDCGGSCTAKCAIALGCSSGGDCQSGFCHPATKQCDAPLCNDGLKNGSETDVDCGGTCTTNCVDGKVCKVDVDCKSTFCHPTTLVCTAPVCGDGFKNGAETDLDCGGACTAKCASALACKIDGDCTSTFCHPTSTTCVAPACGDGFKNGSETDLDCGGACTAKCDDTLGCTLSSDCKSAFCNPVTTTCAAPTCGDGFKNASETDVDCGGTCAADCDDGKGCAVDGDCQSTFCDPRTNQCAAPACGDGFKNGEETDLDCGGPCLVKCADTLSCNVHADCESGFCNGTTKKCATPACNDGFKNGAETDVDCAGACVAKCADGAGCLADGDCVAGFCNLVTKKCASATCGDGFKNGPETDVDCGGACTSKCADGLACAGAGDCTSGFCHPSTKTCAASTCNDGFKNGSETDIDCGGACPGKCADTLGCGAPIDCQSGVCSGGTCAAPSCGDGVKNGTEKGVDCAGACPLPCDPTLVATPIDPTITTDILEANRFLCQGADAIQKNCPTFDERRFAIVRGKVMDKDGAPLSGVTVKVAGRPELGSTVSRADGMF